MVIDGTTQEGWGGGSALGWAEISVVRLLNTTTFAAITGLVVDANGCTIKGLEVSRFASDGISIYWSGNVVADCFLHENGYAPLGGHYGSGVALHEGASNDVIGGTSSRLRNVISANGSYGVLITGIGTTGNTVLGNTIGTAVDGQSKLLETNQAARNDTFQLGGVVISGGAAGNTVGGTTTARNVISGDGGGVIISGDGTSANVVERNYIGTSVTRTFSVGNYTGVILGSLASSNTIGGYGYGAGNLISGNLEVGVDLSYGRANSVVGNRVGTDAASLHRLSIPAGQCQNSIAGIRVDFGQYLSEIGNNRVGGNDEHGILVDGSTINNQFVYGDRIEGNQVGAVTGPLGQVPGTFPLANALDGIKVEGDVRGVTIAANLISANGWSGISILDGEPGQPALGTPTDIHLEDNDIGTDGTGASALGNGRWGVYVQNATNTRIGSTVAGLGNVISGNGAAGIAVYGSGTTATGIFNNRICTDLAGTGRLGNGTADMALIASGSSLVRSNTMTAHRVDGVELQNASGNRIELNTVTTSGRDGVSVHGAGTGNTVGGTGGGNAIGAHVRYGVAVYRDAADLPTPAGTVVAGNLLGRYPISGGYTIGNSSGIYVGPRGERDADRRGGDRGREHGRRQRPVRDHP